MDRVSKPENAGANLLEVRSYEAGQVQGQASRSELTEGIQQPCIGRACQMTVRELIEQLMKFSPETRVITFDLEGALAEPKLELETMGRFRDEDGEYLELQRNVLGPGVRLTRKSQVVLIEDLFTL
jgi:hypothetical protein